MDWGGIIAGAMGGLANATGSIADDQIKANARAKEMELQEQRSIAGEQRRAVLQRENFEFEANRKLEMQQKIDERNAATQIKAEEASKGIGDERRFAKFKADLGKTDATDEQLREVFNSQYDSKRFMAGDKVESPYVDKGSDRAGDVVNALKQQGAGSGLVKSAMDEQKLQAAAEQKAAELAAKERRDVAMENYREGKLDNDGRRLEILASRAAGGQGAREGESKFTAAINSAQRNLSTTEEKVGKRFRPLTKLEEMDTAKVDAYQKAKNDFIDADPEVKAQRDRVYNLREKEATSLFPDKLNGGKDKPAPAMPMPKTKDALKKDGVYETARGPARWNGTAFEPI